MRKFNPLLAVCACAITLFSCQKDISVDSTSRVNNNGNNNSGNNNSGNNSNQSIQGNWAFVSISAKTHTVQQVSAGGEVTKKGTLSDYTTENNKGDVTIDATKFIFSDMSYSANILAKGYVYINNILEDTLEMPMPVSMPPFSATTTYKLIGADSISMATGIISVGGLAKPTMASNGRYKIDGDKLYITVHINEDNTQTIQGVPVLLHADAVATATYKRK